MWRPKPKEYIVLCMAFSGRSRSLGKVVGVCCMRRIFSGQPLKYHLIG